MKKIILLIFEGDSDSLNRYSNFHLLLAFLKSLLEEHRRESQ